MRVLLGLIVLALCSQAVFAGVLRPPSLARPQGLLLRSFVHISELQREVDMLVARGYLLFAGEFHNDKLEVIGKEFILIRDADSPVYRYGENKLAFEWSDRLLGTKGISKSFKDELSSTTTYLHAQDHMYLPDDTTRAQKSRLGWYNYILETADGSYPEVPTEINMLKLKTLDRTVELQPVRNYRIYRGSTPLQDIVPNLAGHVTETVVINGNNPYVVYRHTQVVRESGEVSDRLSIGIYPRIALQPYLVDEQSVIIEGSDAVGSKMYQLVPNNDGDVLLNYGSIVNNHSKKIPLQLVKQSEVWNEYDGNIGTTGAGVENMLKYNYLNGESSD